MSFNGKRLGVARKRRMMNKKAFADACKVTQHTAGRWESGATVPSDDYISIVSEVTRFPSGFFFDPDPDEAESASFRSQTSMSSAIRDAALAAGAIGFILSDWIEDRFSLPKIQVPDLHLYPPAHAARVLREEWQLGERPISNMIHLLESKGVRVFSLAENTVKVNAYSIWRRDKPYVFLNTFKTAESSRFDAAHELAHLVLHQDGAFHGREAEDQAHEFAAAFLMPRSDVLATIPQVKHLGNLLEAKSRWKVSLAALNYRIHKLKITTDWKYRDFCIEIATRNYNKHEPNPIPRERSVVWEKVLRGLWAERTTQRDIAKSLNIPESEVHGLVFGIVADRLEPPTTGQAPKMISSA